MLESLQNSPLLKKAALPYPEISNEFPDDEGNFVPSEEWLAWRAQFPCGHFLAKALQDNKSKIIGRGHKDVHEYESTHIADPGDYLGTRPDNEIRWKV